MASRDGGRLPKKVDRSATMPYGVIDRSARSAYQVNVELRVLLLKLTREPKYEWSNTAA